MISILSYRTSVAGCPSTGHIAPDSVGTASIGSTAVGALGTTQAAACMQCTECDYAAPEAVDASRDCCWCVRMGWVRAAIGTAPGWPELLPVCTDAFEIATNKYLCGTSRQMHLRCSGAQDGLAGCCHEALDTAMLASRADASEVHCRTMAL